MSVVAIIQARMGSTRLPGKVMRVLGDTTVLGHVVRRTAAATSIDAVVVATTLAPRDSAIVQEAERLGVQTYRGSEEDVLERYHLAARSSDAAVVVRVTSDCPLLDPQVVDAVVRQFTSARASGAKLDYLSNTLR